MQPICSISSEKDIASQSNTKFTRSCCNYTIGCLKCKQTWMKFLQILSAPLHRKTFVCMALRCKGAEEFPLWKYNNRNTKLKLAAQAKRKAVRGNDGQSPISWTIFIYSLLVTHNYIKFKSTVLKWCSTCVFTLRISNLHLHTALQSQRSIERMPKIMLAKTLTKKSIRMWLVLVLCFCFNYAHAE